MTESDWYSSLTDLDLHESYNWDELAQVFQCRPAYFSAAGGMISRPALNVLVLVTHPGGGRSFDYQDYWDGADLVYTGKGQTGDQKLEGENRFVADNSRQLHVFEASGPKVLTYLGRAQCVATDWDTGPDKDGHDRKILRFRLRFIDDPDASPVVRAVGRAKFFGGGESDAHRDLKNYVAENPQVIGLPANARADVEHSFMSPDRADIVFTVEDGNRVAVEIELEGTRNTVVGAWQAIEYRALLCLEEGGELGSGRAHAVLVAYRIPGPTRAFCGKYDVECHEIPPPHD